MATITLTVTVANPGSGNRYYIDGVLQATVSAIPGNTYIFDQADGTNSGHPLRLSITSNGTHGGGSAYTDGVTTSGTPGSGGAYTQIVVDATTVQTLYYYCTAHSGMGGSFNVGSSSTVKLKDIKGFTVQTLSSDPTTPASVGQFYFNSTSNTFKYVQPGGAAAGTWASGGALGTARYGAAGTGSTSTQAAGLVFGGDTGSGTRMVAVTEEYNGTAWTEKNDLNTARGQAAGGGTTTAALAFSGEGPPPGYAKLAVTENYNGSSWTEVADLNTARYAGAGFGTTTAALMTGGTAGPGVTADTETWNGSAWTEVSNLNTARGVKGSGTTTDGVVVGSSPSASTAFENWDGTSWTNSTAMNTARSNAGCVGNTTLALAFGGTTPASGKTEYWDGSAWTEVADMANSLNNTGASGNTTACFAAGGYPQTTATEEWTAPDLVIKTVTTS